MLGNTTALLVSGGGEPFEKLELALNSQSIKTYGARSSAEVLVLLEQADSPQMIFTDTTFTDGTLRGRLEFGRSTLRASHRGVAISGS